MARKPKVEIELDEEETSILDTLHDTCMGDISEILGTAFNEVEARVRTLIDEMEVLSK